MDKYFITNFRDRLLHDVPGTNSVKLAFALGYFECVLTALINEDKRNRDRMIEITNNYIKRIENEKAKD